jgi:HlyD family secretion protein
MDTSALIAKLHVGQTQAQNLRLGAPATVKVPGIDDPVPAKVSLISPALDPGSTTVEVWLRVENPKGTYKAGTPVHASITGRTVPNAITVPAEAIQTATGGAGKFVMVIGPDSAAHKKPVTLGIVTKDDAQVLSGIAQQDMVISTGGYGLDEGTKVKIGTDPDAKPDADDKSAAGGKDADDK